MMPGRKGAEMPRYYLNPDFKRDAPKSGRYCVRCQRRLRDRAKVVHVTVDWETWQVTEGGEELMGADCWKGLEKCDA